MQTRLETFDEGSRKRPLPSEPTDGLDNAKRMRLGAELPERPGPLSLPPGPVSFAQLFTLTDDRGLSSFDVTQLPIELVVKITLPVLHSIEQPLLDEAINNVRARYLSFSQSQSAQPHPLSSALGDDEEDYEPDFEPSEEKVLDGTGIPPFEGSLATQPNIALGPFKLRPPHPLTLEETEKIGKATVDRVFGMMSVFDEPSTVKKQKTGLNRLAGSNYDRDAWITVITRLATRASGFLEYDKGEGEDEINQNALARKPATPSISDKIRDTLWKFIIEDFRSRIAIAIAWLNEEWFNDRIQAEASRTESSDSKVRLERHYENWMLKILDSIVPFLDAKDKVLIRFLSEIPEINERVLDRVKGLAKDPERVTLAVTVLQ